MSPLSNPNFRVHSILIILETIVALHWHLPKVGENTNGVIVQRALERTGMHHTQTKRKLIIDTHLQLLLN